MSFTITLYVNDSHITSTTLQGNQFSYNNVWATSWKFWPSSSAYSITAQGSSFTFSAEAESGYKVSSWTYRINGGAAQTYTGATFVYTAGSNIVIHADSSPTVQNPYSVILYRNVTGLNYIQDGTTGATYSYNTSSTTISNITGSRSFTYAVNSGYQKDGWEYSYNGATWSSYSGATYTTSYSSNTLHIRPKIKAQTYTIYLYKGGTGITSQAVGNKSYTDTSIGNGITISASGNTTFRAAVSHDMYVPEWTYRIGSSSATQQTALGATFEYTGSSDIYIHASAVDTSYTIQIDRGYAGISQTTIKFGNSNTNTVSVPWDSSHTWYNIEAWGTATISLTTESDRYQFSKWSYNMVGESTGNETTTYPFKYNTSLRKAPTLQIHGNVTDSSYKVYVWKHTKGVSNTRVSYGNTSSYHQDVPFNDTSTQPAELTVWGNPTFTATVDTAGGYSFLKWKYYVRDTQPGASDSATVAIDNPYTMSRNGSKTAIWIRAEVKSTNYTIHLFRDSTGIATTTAGSSTYENTFASQGSDTGVDIQANGTSAISFDAATKHGYAFDGWTIREGTQSASPVSPRPTARPYTYTPVQKADGTGYKDIWIRATARERTGEKPAIWDWNIQNVNATADQTKTAYRAVTGKGNTKDFSYVVWNDLCDKVNSILSYDGRTWATKQSGSSATYLDLANTKMTGSNQNLTATRFNALRFNIGARYSVPVPSNPDDESQAGVPYATAGAKVYGRYFTRLTDYINAWIESL